MEQTDEKSALAKIHEILNKAAVIHQKTKEVVED
jgi:CarD family transcriptional regulator